MSNATRQATKEATKNLPRQIYHNILNLDDAFFTGDANRLDGLGRIQLPPLLSNKPNMADDQIKLLGKELKKGVIPENFNTGKMVVLKKGDNGVMLYRSKGGDWKPAFKLERVKGEAGKPDTFKQVYDSSINPDALKRFQASNSKQGIVAGGENGVGADFAVPTAKDVRDTGALNQGGSEKYRQSATILPDEWEMPLSDPNAGAGKRFLGWMLGARGGQGPLVDPAKRTPNVIESGWGRTANTLWRPAGALTLSNQLTSAGFGGMGGVTPENPEGNGWLVRGWNKGIKEPWNNFMGYEGSEASQLKKDNAEVANSATQYTASAAQKISPTFTFNADTLDRQFNAGAKNYNPSALSGAFSTIMGNKTQREFFEQDPNVMLESLGQAYADQVSKAMKTVAQGGNTPKPADYPDITPWLKEVAGGDSAKASAIVLPSWTYKSEAKGENGEKVTREGVKAMVGKEQKTLIPIIVASKTKEEGELEDKQRIASGKPKAIGPSTAYKYMFIDHNEKDPTKKFYSMEQIKLVD